MIGNWVAATPTETDKSKPHLGEPEWMLDGDEDTPDYEHVPGLRSEGLGVNYVTPMSSRRVGGIGTPSFATSFHVHLR